MKTNILKKQDLIFKLNKSKNFKVNKQFPLKPDY